MHLRSGLLNQVPAALVPDYFPEPHPRRGGEHLHITSLELFDGCSKLHGGGGAVSSESRNCRTHHARHRMRPQQWMTFERLNLTCRGVQESFYFSTFSGQGQCSLGTRVTQELPQRFQFEVLMLLEFRPFLVDLLPSRSASS